MLELGEGESITAGPAPGIEDGCLIWQSRHEAAVEQGQVEFDGVVEEGISLLLIVLADQVKHRKNSSKTGDGIRSELTS